VHSVADVSKDCGVVPPNQQTGFESVSGYEWANRISTCVKELAAITVQQTAFPQANYALVTAHDPGLTNDRVLTAGTNISIVDGGAKGPVTINATAASFPQANYALVTAHDAGLTNDRLLTAGTGISIVDGGAKGPVTINATGGIQTGWFFGDGSDGAFTYDGVATNGWSTLIAGGYKLSRTPFHTTAIINSGVKIALCNSIAYQFFANVSITGIDATSIIEADGIDAVTQGAGVSPNSGTGIYGGPGAGASGPTGVGANGFGTAVSIGGSSGVGGHGTPVGNTGGGAGAATPPSLTENGIHGMALIPTCITGNTNNANKVGCGAGAPSGGGDGTHHGGDGGSGGGMVGVFTPQFLGAGTLSARGGNGFMANPIGNAGGGAGAGGGGIFAMSRSGLGSWTTNVPGGLGGAGAGTGVAGTNGQPGNAFSIVI